MAPGPFQRNFIYVPGGIVARDTKGGGSGPPAEGSEIDLKEVFTCRVDPGAGGSGNAEFIGVGPDEFNVPDSERGIAWIAQSKAAGGGRLQVGVGKQGVVFRTRGVVSTS